MKIWSYGVATIALITPMVAAHAQSQSAPQDAGSAVAPGDEIVVTGTRTFLSADTSGTTGLPLPIEKVPQSISLVSSDFLRIANLRTVGDVAEYTAGAVNSGDQEGFGAQIKLRGFSAGTAVDGLTTIEQFDPDYATIERLEVVKGPSSVIYGVSSPGGLVNRVTKNASANTPSYVDLQGGSWGFFRGELQLSSALDKDGNTHGLLVVSGERGDSFQDYVGHNSISIYGAVNTNLADNVKAYVHANYAREQRTTFDGIPTEADGSPAPVPRSFFIGSPDQHLTTNLYFIDGNITWSPTDMLDISVKGLYQRGVTRGLANYSFGLDDSGNIGVAVRRLMPSSYTNEGGGLSANYKLDNVGMSGSFITASALYQAYQYNRTYTQGLFNGSTNGTANIFAGEAAIASVIDTDQYTAGSYNRLHQGVVTLGTQSVLKPIPQVSILLGGSYSKAYVHSDNNNGTGFQAFDPKGRMSYRAGITYEPIDHVDIYGSFSQSFSPQTLLDVKGNVLAPLTGKQYEVGAKYRVVGDRILLTAAAFQIDQANTAEFDAQVNGNDRYKAVGKVRHRGIELQALGRVTKELQVNLGYTYLDPKVTADTDTTIIGKQVLFVPRNTVSGYATYQFDQGMLNGFSIGGGVRYIGPQKTSYDGSTGSLKSYTIADATLSYTYQKWLIQLNIRNVCDKHYYINTYDSLYYGNVVGTPRSVLVSLNRSF